MRMLPYSHLLEGESVKLKLLLFLIMLFPITAFSQNAASFFPHHTGDTWEYDFFESSRYNPDDTLQTEIIVDSVGSDGSTYLTRIARSINPLEPPIFFFADTEHFRIDTSQTVYGPYFEFGDTLLPIYKLNADKGDKWIIIGQPYRLEMARIVDQWQEYSFGKMRTFKAISYYLAQDTTDTLGLTRYADWLVEGLGLHSRGWGDTFSMFILKGAVINDSTYGDVTDITAVPEPQPLVPLKMALYQNYPNPFNPQTTIRYSTPVSGNVKLTIYNVPGQQIVTLADGFQPAGEHQVKWNGVNSAGQKAASGIYFYELRAGKQRLLKKMMLWK